MAIYRAEKLGGKVGHWVARWYEAGKPKEATFPTQGAAKDHWAKMRPASRQAASACADGEIKVSALADRWIAHVRATSKYRTAQNYGDNMTRHILPHFGEWKVRNIHHGAVESWVNSLAMATEKRSALSPTTRALLLSILGTFCSYAIHEHVITVNPCANVGKFLKLNKVAKREQNEDDSEVGKAFTREELRAVLDWIAVKYPRNFPLFAFMARSGCRIGEVLGVKWADIGRDEVTVSRQRDGKRIDTPKGGEARVIHLGNHLDLTAAVPVLADVPAILHRAEIAEKEAALKRGRPISEFCFTTSTGAPENESNVRRILQLAVEGTKVTDLSPHGMRHAFGSILATSGESLEYIRRQMGHTDLKVTQKYIRGLDFKSARVVESSRVAASGERFAVSDHTAPWPPVVTAPSPAFHEAVAAEAARPRLVAVK